MSNTDDIPPGQLFAREEQQRMERQAWQAEHARGRTAAIVVPNVVLSAEQEITALRQALRETMRWIESKRHAGEDQLPAWERWQAIRGEWP